MTVTVILNPAAGGGRARRCARGLGDALRAALGSSVEVIETRAAGDAERRAELAVLEGARTLLSVGGDGTHSEVVNGILRAAPEPGSVSLGVLHAGTGGDFRRLVRDSGESLAERALELLSSRARPIDVGMVGHALDGDSPRDGEWRYFLNIAGFGLGGLVDRYANRSSKRLGGKATYYLATLQALARFRPATVALEADGEPLGEVRATSVIVANGRYAGGGMLLAPQARLGDGLLDVVVLRAASAPATIGLTRHLYDGTLLESPLVEHFRCRQLVARAVKGAAWLDVDGESPGQLPASFGVVPGAIQLLGPRPGVV